MRAAALLLLAAALAPARADEALTLYYNERPPYLQTAADGSVAGLVADPVNHALRAAGLQARWLKVPTNRQIAVIRAGREIACAVGWFRNAERESFARFSRPLYQDRPTVALAHGGFQPQGDRLADQLRERHATVLVKDGFSYGPFIDGLMKQWRPPIVSTTVENLQMVQMIVARRADFMYVSEEEAGYIVAHAEPAGAAVKIVRFADMPPGERRHLMCTQLVPEDWLARINGSLPAD